MRRTNYKKLDDMFIARWSPREFLPDAIESEDVETLFEAARWSPSCFNEQPWRFVYANTPDDVSLFRTALVKDNQGWTENVPLLVFVFSKIHFAQNSKLNKWAGFDTGAAWMALTLQANRLGIHTHAMGGIKRDVAFEVTGMDSDAYDVVCAIALGRINNHRNEDDKTVMSDTSRLAHHEIAFPRIIE